MLADIGQWGSIAGIGSFGLVVAGILLTQVRRARGKGMTRRAIDEVVVGVPAVISPTGRVIQEERPGLIDRMDDMDEWRGSVDSRLDEILDRVTPNGGDTKNPGDTTTVIEKHLKQIADHVGLELEA